MHLRKLHGQSLSERSSRPLGRMRLAHFEFRVLRAQRADGTRQFQRPHGRFPLGYRPPTQTAVLPRALRFPFLQHGGFGPEAVARFGLV